MLKNRRKMNEVEEIQDFVSLITNRVKPVFETLIRKTTREDQFPVIKDINDPSFKNLLDSSVDYVKTIIHLLTDNYSPFKELYSVCQSLLCKDETLTRISSIYAEFLRICLPAISTKSRSSHFFLKINDYTKYLVPVIIFSSINLSNHGNPQSLYNSSTSTILYNRLFYKFLTKPFPKIQKSLAGLPDQGQQEVLSTLV